MRYLVYSVLLIAVNLFYSSWSTHVSRQYARGFRDYRNEVERNLKLKAQIEGRINYNNAREYASKRGFIPIDWDNVLIVKDTSK